MFRILGHLYVGSDLAAESKSDLDTHEITKILSLEESKVFAHNNIQYRRVHVKDIPSVSTRSQAIWTRTRTPLPHACTPTNLFEVLPQIFEFLDDQNPVSSSKTLIHCQSGLKQSVVIVIAYLVVAKGWPLSAAATFVRDSVPNSCPSPAYLYQLIDLEKCFHKHHTIALPHLCSIFYGRHGSTVRTTSSTEIIRDHSPTSPSLSPFEKANVTWNNSWKETPHSPQLLPPVSLSKRSSTVGVNLQQKNIVFLGQPGTPGALRELPEVKKLAGKLPILQPISG